MKIILSLIIAMTSFNSFAFSYGDKVPGKNYTYGDFILNRAIVNKLREDANKDSLKGDGMEFQGNIIIKKEKVVETDSAGLSKTVEKKKYKVYIRNCGEIDVPEKDENYMKKVFNGTRIRMYLIGSSCKVSDWEIF